MTISEKLDEARKEYHALMTGLKARVFVDQNGERVEYVSASAGRLLQYIKSLEAELDSTARPPGPMRVFF